MTTTLDRNSPRGEGTGARVAMAAVTDFAVHLPGAPGCDRPVGVEPGVPPERAHELLGRKGLLGKDDATRLALCATHTALGRTAKQPRPTGEPDPRTAVVVSSNLGNVGTVADIVRTVRESGGRHVSPLQAPNASSNVIASALAIWFRLAGPNLMVCSGAVGGLDAIGTGTLLLRAGRADRVVVVGCEPEDADALCLYPVRAAAACVVLRRPDNAAPTAPRIGRVRSLPDPGDARPDPATAGTYGAAGVLGVAIAALRIGQADTTVVCGDGADGWRAVDVFADDGSR
jgi:3-oxoacyl-[acyl-carrier-protein] synthase II